MWTRCALTDVAAVRVTLLEDEMLMSPRKPACIWRPLDPLRNTLPEGASNVRGSFGGDWTCDVVKEPSIATPKGPAAYSWLAVTTSCSSDRDRRGL